MIKDIHKIKECPDCGSRNIKYNDKTNQVLCRDCGLIYEPMAPEAEKKFEKTHNLK